MFCCFSYNRQHFQTKFVSEPIILGNLDINIFKFTRDQLSFSKECFVVCAGLDEFSENVRHLRARGPKFEMSTPAARLEKSKKLFWYIWERKSLSVVPFLHIHTPSGPINNLIFIPFCFNLFREKYLMKLSGFLKHFFLFILSHTLFHPGHLWKSKID